MYFVNLIDKKNLLFKTKINKSLYILFHKIAKKI